MSPDESAEQLAVLRVGDWKFALPLRHVDRILSAAQPVAIPTLDGSLNMVVRLEESLVPVVFAAGLFGAAEVVLHPSDKMVVTTAARGRCILWVSAVEDLVPFVPLEDQQQPNAPAGGWVACFCGGAQALAVLDVDRLTADRWATVHSAPLE